MGDKITAIRRQLDMFIECTKAIYGTLDDQIQQNSGKRSLIENAIKEAVVSLSSVYTAHRCSKNGSNFVLNTSNRKMAL